MGSSKANLLQGRTIVVTGASIGLGRAMALALAEAGADVAALDLPGSHSAADALVRTAQEMGCAGTILPVFADVTDDAAVQAAMDAAEHRFGALYGLVNNAAIGMQDIGPVQIPPRRPFYDVPVETWRRVIDTNLNGPFTASRCIAPRLIAAARGSIVNLVTSYQTMHNQGFSPYGPTKAALETATAIWAKDLAARASS